MQIFYILNRNRMLLDLQPPDSGNDGYDAIVVSPSALGTAASVPSKIIDLTYMVSHQAYKPCKQCTEHCKSHGTPSHVMCTRRDFIPSVRHLGGWASRGPGLACMANFQRTVSPTEWMTGSLPFLSLHAACGSVCVHPFAPTYAR